VIAVALVGLGGGGSGGEGERACAQEHKGLFHHGFFSGELEVNGA
jgi:hypothetical protein